jgi:ATP-dependent DNA helicase RecG
MNLNAVKRLVALGEGSKLEFKRSTGELREALHTVCAFLNADGGKVLFGVRPDGTLVGQEVSDKPLCYIAQALESFDSPVRIETERVRLKTGHAMLICHVEGLSDLRSKRGGWHGFQSSS